MTTLTDRQAVELLLPTEAVRLVLRDGVAEQDDDFRRCMELLGTAQREVLTARGGTLKDQTKIGRRTLRALGDAVQPHIRDGVSVGKVGLIVFFWIRALTDSGYLVFGEGSAIDRALQLFTGAIEHYADEPKVRASAEKQARRLLAALQARGLYQGCIYTAEKGAAA